MYMKMVGIYTSLLMASYAIASKMCTNPERLISFESGGMLPDVNMMTLKTEGLMVCAKQCLLRRKCKSLNFFKESGECQLNSQTVDPTKAIVEQLQNVDGADFSESSRLPQRLAGVCANHQCPVDTMCKAMDDTYDCKAFGCTGTPSVEHGFLHNETTDGESEVGTTYMYGCNSGYLGAGHVTCLRGGTWSSGVCEPIFSTCRKIQECRADSQDGEYWLTVSKFNNYKALIYCHGMNTDSPMEYISLPYINHGIYPELTNIGCRNEVNYLTGNCVGKGGESWYSKIRVNIKTMKVNITNKYFSNFTNDGLRYGTAADCYTNHYDYKLSQCGTKGRFTIDLRATGWKVKSDQKWVINGHKAIIEYVLFEREGTIVKLACGGRSGTCRPEVGLFLEPYPADAPNNYVELICS